VLEIMAIAAGVLLVGAFLATYKHGTKVLSFVIGAAAALILVQFNGVHLYTLLVILYVAISKHTRTRIMGRLILLVAAAAIFASTVWFGALVRTDGLAIQLMLLSTTTALFVLRSADYELMIARLGLLTAVTLGSLTAIAQAIGILPEQLFQLANAELERPSGFYPEPDWLGLFSAAGLVLAVTTKSLRMRTQVALIAINAAGVMLSSARAAFLSLAVVALWAMLRALRGRRKRIRRQGSAKRSLAIVGLGGSVLALIVFPVEVETLLSRLSSALGAGDHATRTRLNQFDGLLSLVETAPFYGHGITASGRVNGLGQIDYSSNTVGTTGSNWLLSVLGEGMLLAVPVIILLAVLAFFGNARLGSGLVLLVLVNSLFSNAMYFPLTWFAIALALVPASVETDDPEPHLDKRPLESGHPRTPEMA
jgi:hypothetical protein